MTHAEIEELLGAYALDAVDASEARVVEAHLAECPRCRAEVAAHREVASLLGNAGGSAPDGLWDRIATELDAEFRDVPPVPEIATARLARAATSDRSAPRTAGRSQRVVRPVAVSLAAVAAALALVVGLLSAKVSSLDSQVRSINTAMATDGTAQLSALALADPAHRRVELDAAVGRAGPRAVIVMLPGGQAYWVTEAALHRLPANETYQLWAEASGRVVSIGLLGSAPKDVAVQTTANMTKFMVTAEPLGGTSAPTSPVVVESVAPPT
jgi:hypothetical protein